MRKARCLKPDQVAEGAIPLSANNSISHVPDQRQRRDLHVDCVNAELCNSLFRLILGVARGGADLAARRELSAGLNTEPGAAAPVRLAFFAREAFSIFGAAAGDPESGLGEAQFADVLEKIHNADPDRLEMWCSRTFSDMAAMALPSGIRMRGHEGHANLDRFLRLVAILEWVLTVPSSYMLASLYRSAISRPDPLHTLMVFDRAYGRDAEGITGPPPCDSVEASHG
jgi:hypothetical protein